MQFVFTFRSLTFVGSVRQLRAFLRSLPREGTLRAYLQRHIH